MHWTEPSETENAATHCSGQELRKQLIADRAVDVRVAVGPNLFNNVTLFYSTSRLPKNKHDGKPSA